MATLLVFLVGFYAAFVSATVLGLLGKRKNSYTSPADTKHVKPFETGCLNFGPYSAGLSREVRGYCSTLKAGIKRAIETQRHVDLLGSLNRNQRALRLPVVEHLRIWAELVSSHEISACLEDYFEFISERLPELKPSSTLDIVCILEIFLEYPARLPHCTVEIFRSIQRNLPARPMMLERLFNSLLAMLTPGVNPSDRQLMITFSTYFAELIQVFRFVYPDYTNHMCDMLFKFSSKSPVHPAAEAFIALSPIMARLISPHCNAPDVSRLLSFDPHLTDLTLQVLDVIVKTTRRYRSIYIDAHRAVHRQIFAEISKFMKQLPPEAIDLFVIRIIESDCLNLLELLLENGLPNILGSITENVFHATLNHVDDINGLFSAFALLLAYFPITYGTFLQMYPGKVGEAVKYACLIILAVENVPFAFTGNVPMTVWLPSSSFHEIYWTIEFNPNISINFLHFAMQIFLLRQRKIPLHDIGFKAEGEEFSWDEMLMHANLILQGTFNPNHQGQLLSPFVHETEPCSHI